MGLGNRNENVTYVNLKVYKEEDKPPRFVTNKKENGKWVDDQEFEFIEGKLIKVEHTTFEWDGKEFDKVNLHFKDNGEVIVASCKFGMMTRGILNSLLTIAENDTIGTVKISLYINSNGYKQAYVQHNGEPAPWMHDWDWQKEKVKQVKVGKENINDYSKLDGFFINAINGVMKETFKDEGIESDEIPEGVVQEETNTKKKKKKAAKATQENYKKTSAMEAAQGAGFEEEEDDDLPF